VYYPDVQVVCDPADREADAETPCLVVEVLSPSTSLSDLREKRMAYRRLHRLAHVIVFQKERRVHPPVPRRKRRMVRCAARPDSTVPFTYPEIDLLWRTSIAESRVCAIVASPALPFGQSKAGTGAHGFDSAFDAR